MISFHSKSPGIDCVLSERISQYFIFRAFINFETQIVSPDFIEILSVREFDELEKGRIVRHSREFIRKLAPI